MNYKSAEIKVKEADEHDVASALAFLSHFPQGTVFRRAEEKSLFAYHKENIGQEPDFIVRGLGADGYAIVFNERVKQTDIAKIEDEINSDYTRD